jgi:hypothetical protein
MDRKLVAIGIVTVLAVLVLFVSWGSLGAIYPLEGASVEFSGGDIIVSGSGVPQSYNAFFDGGSVDLITSIDAPEDLEEYTVAIPDITYEFGSCGYGPSTSATLKRGTGLYENKIVANVRVPSIRDYWEGGNVMELSPWTFSCGQDALSQQNPSMDMSGSVTFRKVAGPCYGVTCNPIESTCGDGYVASCQTSCSNGMCSTCTPDCSNHGGGSDDGNLIAVIILAVIFIAAFSFIGWKVWGWKR